MLAKEFVQDSDQKLVQEEIKVIITGVVAKAPWRKVRQNGALMTVFSLLCNPGELVDVVDSELLKDDIISVYAFGDPGNAAIHLRAGDTAAIIGVAKHEPEYQGPAIQLLKFESPENHKRLMAIYEYYYNKSLDEDIDDDEYDPEFQDCDYDY